MNAASLFMMIPAVVAGTAWISSVGGTSKADPQGRIIEASFRSSWIEDSDLRSVASLPELRVLDLSHTRVTDLGFRDLKPLANVSDLNLYYAEQIGDGALAIAR